jgi:hypothetical protein
MLVIEPGICKIKIYGQVIANQVSSIQEIL